MSRRTTIEELLEPLKACRSPPLPLDGPVIQRMVWVPNVGQANPTFASWAPPPAQHATPQPTAIEDVMDMSSRHAPPAGHPRQPTMVQDPALVLNPFSPDSWDTMSPFAPALSGRNSHLPDRPHVVYPPVFSSLTGATAAGMLPTAQGAFYTQTIVQPARGGDVQQRDYIAPLDSVASVVPSPDIPELDVLPMVLSLARRHSGWCRISDYIQAKQRFRICGGSNASPSQYTAYSRHGYPQRAMYDSPPVSVYHLIHTSHGQTTQGTCASA
ncbi:hypothetical protein C8J57DRAFT_1257997 [Mycena rebaudengoi]|nr:hypothetical protein C8J57DRAFT_1257997 [Mycena rebaudengoi]